MPPKSTLMQSATAQRSEPTRAEPKFDLGIAIGRTGAKEFEVSLFWRDASGRLTHRAEVLGKNSTLGRLENLLSTLQEFVCWGKTPSDVTKPEQEAANG